MKYPTDIETPLDRRAATIDILAGVIERNHKSIKLWREKAEYHRDHAVKFQSESEELHTRINELENDCLTLEEKISELKTKQNFHPSPRVKRVMRKKRSSNNGKTNGHLGDKYQ